MPSTPTEIIADCFAGEAREGRLVSANEAGVRLRLAGWRVVRTEAHESLTADPRDDVVEIIEEWTP